MKKNSKPDRQPESEIIPESESATATPPMTDEERRAEIQARRLARHSLMLETGQIKHPLPLDPNAPRSTKTYQQPQVCLTLASGRTIVLQALWQSYTGYGWTTLEGRPDEIMAQRDHDKHMELAEKIFGSNPVYCSLTQLYPDSKKPQFVYLPPVLFMAHFRSAELQPHDDEGDWVSELVVLWYGDTFFPDVKEFEQRLRNIPWNECAREWDRLDF